MTPYYTDDYITLFHGDCLEILPGLVGIGSIVTDPPYGIGADKKNAHSTIRDNNDWDNHNWDNERPSIRHFEMMLKSARVCAFWGGNYFADLLPPSSGWWVWRKPEAETGFSLADVELCWTSGEGAARCISLPRRDGNDHPTQKPVALMRWCIQQIKQPGLICDPYTGSGSTLIAAKQLGLKCIGIEIVEAYCEVTAKRVSQTTVMFPGVRLPVIQPTQAAMELA